MMNSTSRASCVLARTELRHCGGESGGDGDSEPGGEGSPSRASCVLARTELRRCGGESGGDGDGAPGGGGKTLL